MTGPPVHSLTGDQVTALFSEAARGVFPEPDFSVRIGPLCGPAAAVVAFTDCVVVATPMGVRWWREVLADGADPMHPRVLLTLADALGTTVGENEAVLAAAPSRTVSLARSVRLVPFDDGHPRVARARRYRDDVRAWTTVEGDGLLVVGRGLAGRWEMSMDVAPRARTRGLGRALAAAARAHVPRGQAVYAQVAPGNAASLRALLAAGYHPVAQEVLFPLRPAGGSA
ncbi:N-acetyltransferase [Saccharomonospora piscinae]|uniref:N-acetyltransferase n=1 Tax=Saccharomonospora piscinae TaxID=687388 RepID=A0A1V9AD17_SACPI|nr:N-acetyltransferase [Saccharomonospora piscinae]OQO95022.1 N-acetyltransferase [Saccharomonospora piscinae]